LDKRIKGRVSIGARELKQFLAHRGSLDQDQENLGLSYLEEWVQISIGLT